MTEAAKLISAALPDVPKLAVILGSGLSDILEDVETRASFDYGELPGFPTPGVAGHRGRLIVGRLGGGEALFLAGRAHAYESGRADAMAGVVETLAALGIERLLLSNAAGGLREDLPPGSLMLLSDHINLTGLNPLAASAEGPRFVDLSAVYDPGFRVALLRSGQASGARVGEGVYMFFVGPSFETPAEIRAAKVLGADAVGMSTVPEAILARAAGITVGGVSVITNMAAGLGEEVLSHAQTLAVGKRAAADFGRLLAGYLEEMS